MFATEKEKLTAKESAAKFKAKCAEFGFEWSAQGSVASVVKIWKQITPGNKLEYCAAEAEASIIFDYVPLKGGSVWGTDGGSVGGAMAMASGNFKMNKSGQGKSFMKALGV
jgi:hypothetical protein